MKTFKMAPGDYILVVAAVSLFIFGFLITAAMIIVIGNEGKDLVTKLIIMVLLGLSPVFLGLYLLKRIRMKKKEAEDNELEQSVLYTAKNKGGIISACRYTNGQSKTNS